MPVNLAAIIDKPWPFVKGYLVRGLGLGSRLDGKSDAFVLGYLGQAAGIDLKYVVRFDKECGASYIPDLHTCHVGEGRSRPSRPLGGEDDFLFGGTTYRSGQKAEINQRERDRQEAFRKYQQAEAESLGRRLSGKGTFEEFQKAEAEALARRTNPSRASKLTLPDRPSTATRLKFKKQIPEIKPIKLDDDLNGVTPINEAQKKALDLARSYQEIIAETNTMLSKIPKADHTLPTEAYERIYSKTNQLMDRLKGAVNDAKGLAGRVGDDTLERYMSTIAGISKESLPGFEIKQPTKDIAKQAEKRPC